MSPFGVFQDFHSLSFCSLEGVRTLTPAGAEPPGGTIREVRKPGLGMETQVFCELSVHCLIPLGKPQVMFFRLCGPRGHCGIRSPDGSTCHHWRSRERNSLTCALPLILSLPYFQVLECPSMKPNYMSHLNHGSLSLLSHPCFTIVISHTHYYLQFNN